MTTSTIDPFLAICGCASLVLTGFAVRQGVRLLVMQRRLDQPEQSATRQRTLLRVLTIIVGLSGVIFSSTLPFNLSIHAGVPAAQLRFKRVLDILQPISWILFVGGAAGLSHLSKPIDAAQARDDDESP